MAVCVVVYGLAVLLVVFVPVWFRRLQRRVRRGVHWVRAEVALQAEVRRYRRQQREFVRGMSRLCDELEGRSVRWWQWLFLAGAVAVAVVLAVCCWQVLLAVAVLVVRGLLEGGSSEGASELHELRRQSRAWRQRR